MSERAELLGHLPVFLLRCLGRFPLVFFIVLFFFFEFSLLSVLDISHLSVIFPAHIFSQSVASRFILLKFLYF